MLGSRILGIRLDAVEVGLRTHAGDLELGHEGSGLPALALDVRDGPLGGKEREARQVLDVALVEDDETGRRPVREEGAQALAPLAELVGLDAGRDCDIGRPYSP